MNNEIDEYLKALQYNYPKIKEAEIILKTSKLALFSLLIILVMSVSMSPANAIFGLSKCEKVKKQIFKEENVRKELWKNLATNRKNVQAKKKILVGDIIDIGNDYLRTLSSDLIMFELARKNSGCFNAKQIANNRILEDSTEKTLQTYQKNLRVDKELLGTSASQSALEWLRSKYFDEYQSTAELIYSLSK